MRKTLIYQPSMGMYIRCTLESTTGEREYSVDPVWRICCRLWDKRKEFHVPDKSMSTILKCFESAADSEQIFRGVQDDAFLIAEEPQPGDVRLYTMGRYEDKLSYAG